MSRAAPLLAALLAALALGACSDEASELSPNAPGSSPTSEPARPRPEATTPTAPWRHLAAHLPGSVAGFRATSDVEENQATADGLPLASAERRYEKDERELVVRIIDTRDAPGLQTAFREVRELNFDSLNELARPTEVGGKPALLQWSRSTGESEVQLMVAGKYIVSVRVWPADTRAEALTVAEAFDLEGLARTP